MVNSFQCLTLNTYKKMNLLTKKIRKQLPALYTNENDPDPKAIVKFFTPFANWTWYATEFDGDDTFFGLVDGFDKELGYFSLAELESMGHKIERDLYFEPTPVSKL
jgi:hypothetical protein